MTNASVELENAVSLLGNDSRFQEVTKWVGEQLRSNDKMARKLEGVPLAWSQGRGQCLEDLYRILTGGLSQLPPPKGGGL